MDFNTNLDHIRQYFKRTLQTHGTTPRGVDWNSEEAHAARFTQLVKILDFQKQFSILDYGCGYGALIKFLDSNSFQMQSYVGYDILDSMIQTANQLFKDDARVVFTSNLDDVPVMDYSIACGVFNLKLEASYDEWTKYVFQCLDFMNKKSRHGFSANFLTKYSDLDRMTQRPDLYYADPGILFDFCKTHLSKNVAILHDYNLFDFTLLVRHL